MADLPTTVRERFIWVPSTGNISRPGTPICETVLLRLLLPETVRVDG